MRTLAAARWQVEKRLRDAVARSRHGLYVPAGALWGSKDIQKMGMLGSLSKLRCASRGAAAVLLLARGRSSSCGTRYKCDAAAAAMTLSARLNMARSVSMAFHPHSLKLTDPGMVKKLAQAQDKAVTLCVPRSPSRDLRALESLKSSETHSTRAPHRVQWFWYCPAIPVTPQDSRFS